MFSLKQVGRPLANKATSAAVGASAGACQPVRTKVIVNKTTYTHFDHRTDPESGEKGPLTIQGKQQFLPPKRRAIWKYLKVPSFADTPIEPLMNRVAWLQGNIAQRIMRAQQAPRVIPEIKWEEYAQFIGVPERVESIKLQFENKEFPAADEVSVARPMSTDYEGGVKYEVANVDPIALFEFVKRWDTQRKADWNLAEEQLLNEEYMRETYFELSDEDIHKYWYGALEWYRAAYENNDIVGLHEHNFICNTFDANIPHNMLKQSKIGDLIEWFNTSFEPTNLLLGGIIDRAKQAERVHKRQQLFREEFEALMTKLYGRVPERHEAVIDNKAPELAVYSFIYEVIWAHLDNKFTPENTKLVLLPDELGNEDNYLDGYEKSSFEQVPGMMQTELYYPVED